jgi:hypothetical protein
MSKGKDPIVELPTAGAIVTATRAAVSTRRPEEPLFRKGVYLTLQQLGNVERSKETGLLPMDVGKYELVDDPSGIVLSYAAGRLLHGILALYESTGREEGGSYKGHFTSYEAYERRDKSGRNSITRIAKPGLYVTEPELLEAYGAGKKESGRYSDKQRQIVRQALDELSTTKQHIYYARPEGHGKQRKRPTVKITAPLLTVAKIEYFDGIEEARAGGDPRATWYKLEPLSVVVDQLVSFHFRSHVALYAQIDDALAELRGTRRGRKGPYHALFIEYLQTLRTSTASIGLTTLANKIRLGYMAKQRRSSDMERAVLEAAEVAFRLGYLLERITIAANSDGRMICYLVLNPEKCSRVKQLADRAEEPEE